MLSKRIIELLLADNVLLAATDQSGVVQQLPEGIYDGTVNLVYTMGNGEAGCFPEIVLETARDKAGPWFSVPIYNAAGLAISGTRLVLPCYEWATAPKGGVANTPLRESPIIQIPSNGYVRARYRETGVGATFGRLSLSLAATVLQGSA